MFRIIRVGLVRLLSLLLILGAAILLVHHIYGAVKRAMYPIEYSEYVERYSEEYGVRQSLIYSVINCESSYNSDAVSSAGAIGLMQITPETFEWLQTKTPGDEDLPSDALRDPETAIKYGTLLLSLHLEEFGGDVPTAMAAYHAGRGTVNAWLAEGKYTDDGKALSDIPYRDTRAYVKSVIKGIDVYKKLYGIE